MFYWNEFTLQCTSLEECTTVIQNGENLMIKMTLLAFTLSLATLINTVDAREPKSWKLGPFVRAESVNPILRPKPESQFFCPMQGKNVTWESDHTFNPGAVVRNNQVFLLYRAEDDYGIGIGHHTSRLGLAQSPDGLHFQRNESPVLFPDFDTQTAQEWPGGCEDPRIVEREDGTYVMTYTQWNHQIAVLGVATSKDLLNWQKHGYVFDKTYDRIYSKSGSIICRCEGDKLIATKIQGKYWMYWGEGSIHLATSDDLISWKPVLDSNNKLLVVLKPRSGKFDSDLVEVGPPAVMTTSGIVLLYNGKNSAHNGDPSIGPGAYSAGQLLLDRNHPEKVIAQTKEPFFKPEMPYETKGQYQDGTVFIQGLVHFHGHWYLYYGGADSIVGVAVSKD